MQYGFLLLVGNSWTELESFYRDVGQHLSKWVQKASKIKDAGPEIEDAEFPPPDPATSSGSIITVPDKPFGGEH